MNDVDIFMLFFFIGLAYATIATIFILGLALAMIATRFNSNRFDDKIKSLKAKAKSPVSDDELDSDDLFGRE